MRRASDTVGANQGNPIACRTISEGTSGSITAASEEKEGRGEEKEDDDNEAATGGEEGSALEDVENETEEPETGDNRRGDGAEVLAVVVVPGAAVESGMPPHSPWLPSGRGATTNGPRYVGAIIGEQWSSCTPIWYNHEDGGDAGVDAGGGGGGGAR